MSSENNNASGVYASPREAAFLFLLPGIVQGLALYGLVERAEDDMMSPLMVASMMFALVAPSAHFLTTTKLTRIPSLVFAVALGAATACLYLIAEAAFGNPDGITPEVLFISVWANLIVCYIAPPFFRTIFERKERTNHYPSLFEFAWNMPVITIAAGLFTLAVWVVLGIWGAMFSLISIDFFRDLFFESYFALPATFAASAVAIGIIREREGIVLALRNVLFALLRVLSPILMFATLLFTISALVQGLDQLWDGWSATSLMVSAITIAVVFSNAVIGDVGTPENVMLRWSVRIQSYVLPVLAAFAAYALFLRLSEYGLTVPRIYALILVIFAVAYAVVWFIGAFLSSGYAFVRQANIWLAGSLFVVAIIVQTPLFNTWQMSANDQVARLNDGRVSAEEFDYGYFQFELGKVGKQALARLKKDEAIPDRDKVLAEIARVEEADSRYDFGFNTTSIENNLATVIADERLRIVPQGAVLDPSLVDFVDRERIFEFECQNKADTECIVLKTSAFVPETEQYILFIGDPVSTYVNVRLFYEGNNGAWQQAYGENLIFENSLAYKAFFSNLYDGSTNAGTVSFRTLDIGKTQVFFLDSSPELRGIMKVPVDQD